MLILLAALLAGAAPTSDNMTRPTSGAAAHGTGAMSRETAATLARTVAPADITIAKEIEQARKAILALPSVDEDARELESQYPGLYAAMWAAIEPEMRRSVEADYPTYWAELERMYVARLTEMEGQAVLTFFRSATGQKLLRGMYAAMDAQPMIHEMVKTDSSTISASQMQTAVEAAKAKVVGQLGPEDEASLVALGRSIDLARFRELGVETQRITLDWVNKEDPEEEERLGKLMEGAMEDYMDAVDAKK